MGTIWDQKKNLEVPHMVELRVFWAVAEVRTASLLFYVAFFSWFFRYCTNDDGTVPNSDFEYPLFNHVMIASENNNAITCIDETK